MTGDLLAATREDAPGIVRVRVPASSANLGPGYDSFGLALGLYDEFQARPVHEWAVEVRGEGAGRAARPTPSNLVAASAWRAFEELGAAAEVPGAAIALRQRHPHRQGPGLVVRGHRGRRDAGLAAGGARPRRRARRGLCAWPRASRGIPTTSAPRSTAASSCARARPTGARTARRFPPPEGSQPWWSPATSRCPRAPRARCSQRSCRTPTPRSTWVTRRSPSRGCRWAGRSCCAPASPTASTSRIAPPSSPTWPRSARSLTDAGADAAALSGAGPTVVGIVTAGDDAAALGKAREIAAAAAVPVSSLKGRCAPLAVPIDRAGAARL